MGAITAISRDWGIDPSIVRVVTTDTLSTIIASGYLTAQAANIELLQNGDFQWVPDDYVLIAYSGGEGFFTYDGVNFTFLPAGSGAFTASVRLTSAQIRGMDAAPVLIIPAPGVGKAIMINRILNTYLFGTLQYTAGGALGLEWGNAVALGGPGASSTLAGATFDGYVASNNFELTPNNTNTLANIANLGVYMSNNTAPFATGDGTLIVNVNYQIVNAV
jgi:hypothetical protein